MARPSAIVSGTFICSSAILSEPHPYLFLKVFTLCMSLNLTHIVSLNLTLNLTHIVYLKP